MRPQLRVSVPKSALTSSVRHEVANGRKVLSYALGRREVCEVWQLAVESAIRARWQLLLEESCLPSPDVYQLHARAKLLPRRGPSQSRMLCLSDRRIYSICREGPTLRGAGWSTDVAALSSVEELELRDRRAAVYPFGLLLRWRAGEVAWADFGAPVDDGPAALFALKGRDDLVAMSACLRQIYRHVVGAPLQVERSIE